MYLPCGLELRFHPEEKCFPSWYDGRDSSPTHPCFVASGVHTSSRGIEFHCETYQFYFKDNLGIGLFGIATKSKALGYHKHDVEGVSVLFDKDSKTPLHVFFKAHGHGQGCWKDWGQCEKNEKGALIVYIAWGSHATYSCSGNVSRIFGLANDSVSSKGKHLLITAANCIVGESFEFMPGVAIHDTLQQLPNRSVSKAERVVLPFVMKKLKKR